jgi:hypothetical protein
MTHDEAMGDGSMVSQREALDEITRHGLPIDEFLDEVGSLASYPSRTVLEWMGY